MQIMDWLRQEKHLINQMLIDNSHLSQGKTSVFTTVCADLQNEECRVKRKELDSLHIPL